MKITYDPTADAMYIYLTGTKTSTRTEEVGEDLFMDFAGKKPMGIEILNVSKHLGGKKIRPTLTSAFPLKSQRLVSTQ